MTGTRALAVCLLFFAALLGACANKSAYQCTGSDQCVLSGVQGVCQPQGFCSFPDTSCPSGQKFEPNAGNGLGGTCTTSNVDAAVPDAPACGGHAQACCASPTACVAGEYCSNGTCSTCVTDFAIGRRFNCLLEHDGTVWCAGANDVGQLGLGVTSMTPSGTFMQVRDSTAALIADATALGAGWGHACAVRTGGTVWCWGYNLNGELGNGAAYPTPPATLPPSAVAVQVVKTTGGNLTNIVSVVAGDNHTCALDSGGGVWCWGLNSSGQLGDGTTTRRSSAAPVLSSGTTALSGANALDSGANFMCARTGSDVYCWGQNSDAELDMTKASKLNPIRLATSTSFVAGRYYTCWLNSDSTESCIGWNGHARLGIGTGAHYEGGDELMPVQPLQSIGGAPLSGIAKISGGSVNCALMLDGHVKCWGDDIYGETGAGGPSMIPTDIVHPDSTPYTGMVDVHADWTRACAHTSSGELLCWGRGDSGEWGDGMMQHRAFPTPLEVACK